MRDILFRFAFAAVMVALAFIGLVSYHQDGSYLWPGVALLALVVAIVGAPRVAGEGAALGLIVAACLVLVTLGVLPHSGRYRTLTVLSGSMQPTFSPNDILVVAPEPLAKIRVGQVITYRIPVGDHRVESHRVVKVTRQGAQTVVETRGDANEARDPWQAALDGPVVWRVRYVIPKLGWLILLLRNPLIHLVAIFTVPAILAILGLWQVWGSGKSEPEPARV
jgi:signal peptidase